MATVLELERQGKLLKLDPALGPADQEFRLIYISMRLAEWLQNVLPTLGSPWNIETSPIEQLDALVAIFASGAVLTFQWQFRPILPIGEGVWELKTADVRIFGWFAERDCFVGVAGDTTERVKHHKLYAGYRSEVVRFRNALPLDEPKFVPGDDPYAVVSNYIVA